MATLRVLVAEHDASLRAMVAEPLVSLGYETVATADGSTALRIGRSGIDVAIVDALLPGIDGLDVVRLLRGEGLRMPILMLGDRSDEIDRIVAYEVGVDDYMPKPFSARELLARMRSVVRRSNMPYVAIPEPLRFGRLEVDESAREARVDGCAVALKPREFGLLLALARHPGIAFSRGSLLERVWGFDFEGDERTVDVHVRRLRLKIEEQRGVPRCLHTVHGFGYKFARMP
jgi:DNA-binding response OmpR family regulator